MVPAFHRAAQLLRHGLLAVADAEDRHARRIDRLRRKRRALLKHRGRPPGQDHALRSQPREGFASLLEWYDFAINFLFTDAPGNKLSNLRAQIDDENLIVPSEPVRIGIAREGGIEKAHFETMCEARAIGSRPGVSPPPANLSAHALRRLIAAARAPPRRSHRCR